MIATILAVFLHV